jgi:NADPH-dependent curcumin reductase CurA
MTALSTLSTLVNHQIRLASRPVGLPTAANWSHTSEPVAEPEEGGVVLKTLALSLDPAMRGWMNEGKSYIPPVGIGEVMRAGGVGRVVASKNERYAVGDYVSAGFGVQEYVTLAKDQMRNAGLVKIDLSVGTLTQWLNVLGMPGMTGYFGLMDVGQPQAGETVVVSGAAGAVGQTVGQMAKIRGCRVVGIAGGAAKCDWVGL